tara:strand:+ start:627 stop:854 length:228 start_codon:yes stop_codon:yes gene_type:complete
MLNKKVFFEDKWERTLLGTIIDNDYKFARGTGPRDEDGKEIDPKLVDCVLVKYFEPDCKEYHDCIIAREQIKERA